jgi:catechol 2,3-dioxygenase-like lactoylglutathione lyase family enzyme
MYPTLDMIGIVVQDMPRALAFYRALGWDIPAEMDQEGHVEYLLPNGLRVAWDTHATIRSFDPDWQPPSGHHRIALAFRCNSPAEIDTVFRDLIAKGYQPHKPPFDAFWGQRYAQIEDPDGNVIDLFANTQ